MHKGLIVFLAMLIVGGGSCVMSIMGVNNTCVEHENNIDAQLSANKISLAGYTNKIMDMVQVPEIAKDHIKEVAVASIEGRYGKEGSKAIFQMIKEQNPTVDASLYRRLMEAMEAGRNGFDADQKTLQDKCRVYRNYYQTAPTSLIVGFLHFPKSGLDDRCKEVTTQQTEEDFQKHTSGPLKLH